MKWALTSRRIWIALVTVISGTIAYYHKVPTEVLAAWTAFALTIIIALTAEDVATIKAGK